MPESAAHPSQAWNASHISYGGGRNDGFVQASGPVAMRFYDDRACPSPTRSRERLPGRPALLLLLPRPDLPELPLPDERHLERGDPHRQRRPSRRRSPTARSSTASTSYGVSWRTTSTDLPAPLVDPGRGDRAPAGEARRGSTSTSSTTPPRASCRSSASSTRTTRSGLRGEPAGHPVRRQLRRQGDQGRDDVAAVDDTPRSSSPTTSTAATTTTCRRRGRSSPTTSRRCCSPATSPARSTATASAYRSSSSRPGRGKNYVSQRGAGPHLDHALHRDASGISAR